MIRYLGFFYLFLFFNTSLFSQIWEKDLIKTNPNPSIQEKIIAFEEFKKTNSTGNTVGYNPYARELDFLLQRTINDSVFNANSLYIEWLKEKKKKNNNDNANWVSKGPINTPIILSNGKKRGNGRINCIAFDPINADIIWVGSPSGGLWKTEDGGITWSTTTDDLPVIGVSSIAINPLDNNIMYIVTGDANASDTYSIGVLKSNDKGVSWNTTGLSYFVDNEQRANKVIINPNHPDSVFAVTNTNIMLSIDAGNNWSSVGIVGRWRDIEFKPGNPYVIYAAKQSNGGSDVYRSKNGGATWNIINSGVASSGKDRPLLAVTPANPNVIYALYSATDDSFHGLYKSSNSGDSWTLQSNSPNILGRDVDGTSSGGQSWYDLSLGVSTVDENLVYVGGINIWKSNDGGVSWNIDANSGNNQQLYSYMHVDQHALEFNPLNDIAYAGNDGGIYEYSKNMNKWVDISDGLEISQFYKLGLSRSNGNRLVAGAQDNGTEMLTGNTWDAIMGGDGMECMIDHYNENIIYAEFQYGGMRKSTTGGSNWNNIKPVDYEGAWVTPYKMHPNNNNLIVAGYDEVYRSISAGAFWDSISYNVSGGQALRVIALAPSNEDYIYAASYTRIKVSDDAGGNWVNIKQGLPNYSITDIAVSHSNPNHLWVSFSGYNSDHKIYESKDMGATWQNITNSGLPNLPVNCIVPQESSNNTIFVGTDVGVYYKNDDANSWSPFMNGLPNVIVRELEIHYGKGTISAATYGRGVWESPIDLTSVIKEYDLLNINIYPNPATENISISVNPKIQDLMVQIYSSTGKLILTTKNYKINTSQLSQGYYIIKVSSDLYVGRAKLIIK